MVRIEASAICGSELKAPEGSNPGHEAAGIVEQSPASSAFPDGTRVGISAVTGCGTCRSCSRGVQLHCEHGFRFHGEMHADFVSVPVAALRRLPDAISARDAVLLSGDALGVPVRSHVRAPSLPGDRVLVIGLGPVGLGHTLVRTYYGASVVGIEPSSYRRVLAMKLGATEVLEPGQDPGIAPQIVIKCTGIPECIHYALSVVEAGGTVLQSGECKTVELNPSQQLIRREVTYTASWYYADADYPEMVNLYKQGLAIDRLITHEFAADDVAAAYATFLSKESGKVILRWS